MLLTAVMICFFAVIGFHIFTLACELIIWEDFKSYKLYFVLIVPMKLKFLLNFIVQYFILDLQSKNPSDVLSISHKLEISRQRIKKISHSGVLDIFC
jgi:hypothetical protein